MIKIAMVVCAVIVVVAVIMTATDWFGGSEIFGSYANAEKYTAGGTEIADGIQNLDIHWTSGKVTVAYHAENTITVAETCSRNLSEDEQLRWWVDGDTLRIQYAKPGLRISFNGGGKQLTVTLPEGIELNNVQINVTSADVTVPELKAKQLDIGATSGDMDVEAEAETVKAGATSGYLKLKFTGKADFIKIGTTSGDVRMEAESVKEIEAGSTSGRLEITAEENEKTEIGCTSGTVRVTLKKSEKLHVGTTSGNVTVVIPAEPGFTAEINSVSGDFNSAMALTKSGNRYSCGDGNAEIDIGTVSGDISIEAVE